MERIIKIGNVELTKSEVEKIYNEGKYICSYAGIFQVHYSSAQKTYYGNKVIDHKGYAGKGRFFIQSAEQINHVLGKKFCQLIRRKI